MNANTVRWACLATLLLCAATLTGVPTWASDSPERYSLNDVKTPAPTHSNVPYGEHERQVLDIWMAESDQPTPVMIYFHGGGFRKGDKKQIQRDIHVSDYLETGITCISANYPYSEDMDIPTICQECENIITLVKANAEKWNIDPTRIGVSGNSAGAIIAFWVGTHRDQDVSVIGATQQPAGTDGIIPFISETSPPCIIYQPDPERNFLHAPANAQLIKDAYADYGVECHVYGPGTNRFDQPPDGKDKFQIMKEFYMYIWEMDLD